MVKGKEEFKLVSPMFKQAIYSGVLEELDPTDTPLDFFNYYNKRSESAKFPLAKEAQILTAKIEAGECLFVPAYYWV